MDHKDELIVDVLLEEQLVLGRVFFHHLVDLASFISELCLVILGQGLMIGRCVIIDTALLLQI